MNCLSYLQVRESQQTNPCAVPTLDKTPRSVLIEIFLNPGMLPMITLNWALVCRIVLTMSKYMLK